MSIESTHEYVSHNMISSENKKPKIPNNKNHKKSNEENNLKEEKLEKISSIRNKKKLESKSIKNKLESSSITSNGNKSINNNNDSEIFIINGNLTFSKIKKITPNTAKTENKASNLRIASVTSLRKNDINGNYKNNQCLIDENEQVSKDEQLKKDNKTNQRSNKNNTNLSNLNNSNYNNNKSSKSLVKNKDLLNNSYIYKRLNNRKSSCENVIQAKKSKEALELNSNEVAKKSKNFSETYERLTNHKSKISSKVENLKKKLEEEELKELKNAPNINKSSKYYEKDSEDFLKRVEIYKFVSKAKRIELIEKDEKKLDEELNKNPKLKKK